MALNTIPEAPNAEIIGLLSQIPIKDSCSPNQFNVKGIPVLAKIKIKNKKTLYKALMYY